MHIFYFMKDGNKLLVILCFNKNQNQNTKQLGATLSKGCNRGTGTLLAGLLAVVIAQLAHMSGGIFHPIIVGVSTFVIGMEINNILPSFASIPS